MSIVFATSTRHPQTRQQAWLQAAQLLDSGTEEEAGTSQAWLQAAQPIASTAAAAAEAATGASQA